MRQRHAVPGLSIQAPAPASRWVEQMQAAVDVRLLGASDERVPAVADRQVANDGTRPICAAKSFFSRSGKLQKPAPQSCTNMQHCLVIVRFTTEAFHEPYWGTGGNRTVFLRRESGVATRLMLDSSKPEPLSASGVRCGPAQPTSKG
jgi:hypothetical protein